VEKKLLVLAGNYNQFKEFCVKNGLPSSGGSRARYICRTRHLANKSPKEWKIILHGEFKKNKLFGNEILGKYSMQYSDLGGINA
jgi:hypothetical protein